MERTNEAATVCDDDDRAHCRCDFVLRCVPAGHGSKLRRSHQCASMAVLVGAAVAGLHVADRRMAGTNSKRSIPLRRLADRQRIVSRVLDAKSVDASVAVRNMGMDGPAKITDNDRRPTK